jgi:GT2 family glycosyltransferase
MENNPMTFCVSCCNNLNYLKLAIHSVRKYSYFKDAPFIVFAENCNDGTDSWLFHNREKYNLSIIVEHNHEPVGIGGGMNATAKLVETEYIMFLHADFFVSKDWDLACLQVFDKHPNVPMWVSSQRFQPNCFNENSRPGTIMFPYEEFGYKHDDFQEQYFIDYAAEFSKLNPNVEITKGEGVSGLIRKKDWDYIGGNDPIYAPAYWEDSDLFIRMQLAEYKFVLTSNSVVFHFGSRSDKSNFPDDNIIRSDRSKQYEQSGARNFFKKWGFMPIWTEQKFVTFPPNVDMEEAKKLIQL